MFANQCCYTVHITLTWRTSCHLFGLNIGMLLAALDFNIIATAVPIISSEL